MTSDKDDNTGCLVIIALAIFIALFGLLIPISYWISLYVVLTLALSAAYKAFLVSTERQFSKFSIAATGIFKALHDTSINILVGLAFVGLCQLLLQVFGFFVEEGTIKGAQLLLFSANEELKNYLGFFPILAAVIIVVTLSFLLKQSSLLHQFLTFKTWAGRLLVTLTVVTSFSFFSANAISSTEQEWKVAVSKEINHRLSAIQRQEKKLLAEAVIKDELLTPHTAKNTRVVQIFRSAVNYNDKQIIVRIAEDSIKPNIAETNSLPELPLLEISRFGELRERFNKTKESEFHQADGELLTLSLRELKEFEAECEERAKIVNASAEAGLEVIKTGLTSFLPEDTHFMVSPFLETLGV